MFSLITFAELDTLKAYGPTFIKTKEEDVAANKTLKHKVLLPRYKKDGYDMLLVGGFATKSKRLVVTMPGLNLTFASGKCTVSASGNTFDLIVPDADSVYFDTVGKIVEDRLVYSIDALGVKTSVSVPLPEGDVFDVTSRTLDACSTIELTTAHPGSEKVFLGAGATCMVKSLLPGEDGAFVGSENMSSAEALEALKLYLTYYKPKMVVWFPGMKEVDTSSSINSTWLGNTQEFLSLCTQYDIFPILVTIPNHKTLNHIKKNEWIRAKTDVRFTDAAKIVNRGEASAFWRRLRWDSANAKPTDKGWQEFLAAIRDGTFYTLKFMRGTDSFI